ncbi:integrin alpha-PS4-like [Euwallacea similis]|uniref:integrin alpha-PS4-like n=1 Tax=Euwallacea similis TaxID=1736056 RepID=UPI00344F968C
MRSYWIVIGIFVIVNLKYTNCYSFNVDSVQVISANSVKNTYFSYSLLLQSGESSSTLIVGAPKSTIDPNAIDANPGGNIYKCDLRDEGSTCSQFSVGRSIDSRTPNGNFFGMSLDGDDKVNGPLVACAPHNISLSNPIVEVFYLRGYCVFVQNSSDIRDQSLAIVPFQESFSDIKTYKTVSYYEFAYAIAGFDISYLSQKEVLLGAPGVRSFMGAAVQYSLNEPRVVNILPSRSNNVSPFTDEQYSYLGYAVSTAKFLRNREDVWYIAGAPRANNLRGKVTIFYYDVNAREKMYNVAIFEGDEVGGYFGSSLVASDVTNDGFVDMLIGAPMSAGKTWDEGHVYFFKGVNERSYLTAVKLTGSSKVGSRFGSAIVSLGDFDLDGYNDVAISAPYEDDGTGAVYIYRGSVEGLTDRYSQRISPSDFNIAGIIIKGFGRGISKGNDIDGNGHNDIAIGAYKTDQVFIIKSYSIVDYRLFVSQDINSITNDTRSFNIELCLLCTRRSEKAILSQLVFNISIQLDYRSPQGTINDDMVISLGRRVCKTYSVTLRKMLEDITNFAINLYVSTLRKDIIAHGDRYLAIQIPYSHGCGDDNQCDTELSIKLQTDSDKLTLGLDKHVDLKVITNNNGEPAYQCKLKLVVPSGLKLRNIKDCIKSEGNYTCLISELLVGSIETHFVFDIIGINPNIDAIKFRVQISSLGVNVPESQDTMELQLPVVLDSTPYITGKLIPEYSEMKLKNYIEDIEVVHQFLISKNGPSPLPVEVEILVPIEKQNDRSIVIVTQVKAIIENIQMECSHDVTFIDENIGDESVIEDSTISFNRTIILRCQDGQECIKIICKGEYLFTSSQLAEVSVHTRIDSNLLASKYKSTFVTKDLIGYVVMAREISKHKTVNTQNMFVIFVHGVKYVPLWVYIIAPVIGIILLVLLIYSLHRCHFFDRIYKDKLKQEKILPPDEITENDEVYTEVDFRNMEENVENKMNEYD